MISLLDTNVLIRFLTDDNHPKYKTLYAFFESLEKGERQTELKLIVLFQTAFVKKSFNEVPRERIAKAKESLLKERLSNVRLSGCWLLRFSPGSGFWRQFYHAGLFRIVMIVLFVYSSSQILMLMNWWIIGRCVFQGYFDPTCHQTVGQNQFPYRTIYSFC